jgi:hypothetical protein
MVWECHTSLTQDATELDTEECKRDMPLPIKCMWQFSLHTVTVYWRPGPGQGCRIAPPLPEACCSFFGFYLFLSSPQNSRAGT